MPEPEGPVRPQEPSTFEVAEEDAKPDFLAEQTEDDNDE